MILVTIIYWFFVRPFTHKAARERQAMRDERTRQRIARHTAAYQARLDAEDIHERYPDRKFGAGNWTDEERAYFAQHAVSPYRQPPTS